MYIFIENNVYVLIRSKYNSNPLPSNNHQCRHSKTTYYM